MLAAKNGHKDVILFLTQKGANLDLVNEVRVHVHMLYVSLSQIYFIVYVDWRNCSPYIML